MSDGRPEEHAIVTAHRDVADNSATEWLLKRAPGTPDVVLTYKPAARLVQVLDALSLDGWRVVSVLRETKAYVARPRIAS